MIRQENIFITEVQATSGTIIDYAFLVTEKLDGSAINAIWDHDQDYYTIITQDNAVQVNTTLNSTNYLMSKFARDVRRYWHSMLLIAVGFGLAFVINFNR